MDLTIKKKKIDASVDISRVMNADNYPPQKHITRDLMVFLEFQGKERGTNRVPVVPQVCTDRGSMHVGVIVTLIDILGALLTARAVSPDWFATSNLFVHTTGRAKSGVVAANGSVMRAGRTAVVVEVDILEEGENSGPVTSIGMAMMTFSRLPRRKETLEFKVDDDSTEAFRFGIDGSGLTRHYLDEIGLNVLDEGAGVVELDMSDYIRNSLHSINGGMVATLADVAGQHAARIATGKPLITTDLEVHYIEQGKIGPFRTRARVLRTTGETALTRVEVIDTGADDRLITVAMNTATLDGKA